jgi:hypothetical protein
MAVEVYPHSRTSSSRVGSMPTSVSCVSPIVASPWPRPITTLFGIARLAAVKAVKQRMKDADLKPALVEMKIITAFANGTASIGRCPYES